MVLMCKMILIRDEPEASDVSRDEPEASDLSRDEPEASDVSSLGRMFED